MIWVDAQLSPALARWIAAEFGEPAIAIRELGLHRTQDKQIFEAARQAGVIVLTKDVDFVDLVERLGPPPQVIWLTCGNTSNTALQTLLRQALPKAITLLRQGEALVEIAEPQV